MEALTLKHVAVLGHHLSLHGELHTTLLRAVTAVLCPTLCWGAASPAPPPPSINHVSCSHREYSSQISPGCSPWEPSVLAPGWQGLGEADRTCCEPLGQHCHVTVPCAAQTLGLLRGRGQYPDRAVPGSLPRQWGLGLQRLHKSCWSWAEGISSSCSLPG